MDIGRSDLPLHQQVDDKRSDAREVARRYDLHPATVRRAIYIARDEAWQHAEDDQKRSETKKIDKHQRTDQPENNRVDATAFATLAFALTFFLLGAFCHDAILCLWVEVVVRSNYLSASLRW